MKLFDSRTSPYCRKVMILAHEAGKVDTLDLAYVAGNAVSPGTMPVAVNPLGKIPCLVREDGPALYDSRVICAYLDDLWGLGLYRSGAARWDVLTLEATADGMLDAALLWVYEHRLRAEDARHEGWVEGQLGKINRGLDALEGRWIAALHGPLSMGHVAVGAMLGYLDFRGQVGDWREGRPQLAAWYAGFATRPSMMATVPVE